MNIKEQIEWLKTYDSPKERELAEALLAQQVCIERMQAWVIANSQHSDTCDVLCLDDAGRHLPCSCGLAKALALQPDLSALREHDAEVVEIAINEMRDTGIVDAFSVAFLARYAERIRKGE
jgi:hypothetical protein